MAAGQNGDGCFGATRQSEEGFCVATVGFESVDTAFWLFTRHGCNEYKGMPRYILHSDGSSHHAVRSDSSSNRPQRYMDGLEALLLGLENQHCCEQMVMQCVGASVQVQD